MAPSNRTNKDDVKKAIREVIVFFDLFNYPLTSFEIWKYLRVKCDFEDVQEMLSQLILDLESKNGFYFLRGRESILDSKRANYNYTDRKFKRAMRTACLFRFIPWIKMIAVANIIGAHNLSDNSDIDLFIIAQKKRVWIVRFFCVLITKILGLRPRPGKMRDTICLSFFVGEDFLNLKKLMLTSNKDGDFSDPYFVYWLAGLVPIYEQEGVYKKFVQSNNWLFKYLPNWRPSRIIKQYFKNIRRSDVSKRSGCYLERCFCFLEEALKKYQLGIMPEKIKNIANKDTRVVLGNDIIKTHTNDRREEYYRKFIARNARITRNV